uniref:NADH dehydrogenase subunit 4L n=1 Tax=Latona dysoni TaxID=3246695 RepID=UPI002113FBE5|nr:NADH dehydrogenase subunit 4L [Donax dysoni]UTM92213.1 NADH dehydrogenase subunit 4L [Donax dysoni]
MMGYLGVFLFIMSVLLIFFQRSHFLGVLLVMELMTLALFFMSIFLLGSGMGYSGISFGLVFMTVGVYEAANGLGLLVSRTRSSGMDELSGLFSLSF